MPVRNRSECFINDVQKVAFELLLNFTEVCKKLNIQYYLVCGSALGAVKYGGFIPWDDDIDVAMIREDYERFLKEAPALLPKYCQLQNIHTNKAFPLLMTKLVNVNTTMIEKIYLQLPIHHGIFIDIFPLDGYPSSKVESCIFEVSKWTYNKLRCVAYRYGYRFFGLNRIMLRYEKLLKRYSCSQSDLVCNHGNWQGRLEYTPREEYGRGTWSEFEGLPVCIPEQYNKYLVRKYGNWQEELPMEQQTSHHKFLKSDPFHSYKEYLITDRGGVRVKDA